MKIFQDYTLPLDMRFRQDIDTGVYPKLQFRDSRKILPPSSPYPLPIKWTSWSPLRQSLNLGKLFLVKENKPRSGYEDLVQAGVRIKNQHYGLLRVCGLTGQEKSSCSLKKHSDQIVFHEMERRIDYFGEEKRWNDLRQEKTSV